MAGQDRNAHVQRVGEPTLEIDAPARGTFVDDGSVIVRGRVRDDGPVRISIRKAYKMYVGGAFVRSESGRYTQVPESPSSASRENVPRASRKDAAGAILFAAETATKLALDAIQILGGNGYINDYPTGRLLRDAKLYEIGAGTSEIRRMLIGRELFRESA
jgi:alkylation response protein AidB-like acyl-CoA dehydrogenase